MSSDSSALTSDRDSLRRIGRKVRKRLDGNKAVKRVEVDKIELWIVPRFFDAIECGRLMSMIDTVARPSTAYEVAYSAGYRTSYSGDLDPYDPLVDQLQKRIDDLLGIDRSQGERLEGQRYLAGQQFQPHNDWFPPDSPSWAREKDRGGQRSFTAMVYLNEVEQGGETDFPELGIAVAPRAGTLLIWNNADADGVPNPATVHAGSPVTRGFKYIVTKWYRCSRWSPY